MLFCTRAGTTSNRVNAPKAHEWQPMAEPLAGAAGQYSLLLLQGDRLGDYSSPPKADLDLRLCCRDNVQVPIEPAAER